MGYSSQKIKPRQTFYTISVQKIMYQIRVALTVLIGGANIQNKQNMKERPCHC